MTGFYSMNSTCTHYASITEIRLDGFADLPSELEDWRFGVHRFSEPSIAEPPLTLPLPHQRLQPPLHHQLSPLRPVVAIVAYNPYASDD